MVLLANVMTESTQGFRRLGTSIALVVSFAIVGCATHQTQVTSTGDSVFAQIYRDAQEYGASESQLDALTQADLVGDLSYETLALLIDDTFTCLDEAGIPYLPVVPLELVPGFSIPSYSVGSSTELGPDTSFAIAQQCQSTYSEFAERAYQMQPRAQALRDNALESELPQVLECLKANGVDLDPEATLDEVRYAVSQVAYDTSLVGSAVVCSTY